MKIMVLVSSFKSLSRTFCSVRTSKLLVDSSKTKTFAGERIALAIANHCLCPPDNNPPFSDNNVSYCIGSVII